MITEQVNGLLRGENENSDICKISFSRGTCRIKSPEETLKTIQPLLPLCGITRCTSVTGLDRIGIPSYCSIRPRGIVLQVSNGKGITDAAAEASAAMEAVELHHSENPDPGRFHIASVNEMANGGRKIISPETIDGFRPFFFTNKRRLQWIEGVELCSGESLWAPASAVYFLQEPSFYDLTSNGLASGNHPLEAKLHGLYELLERDAVARVSENGKLKIRKNCSVINLETIDDPDLAMLTEKVVNAGLQLILLHVNTCRVPLPTFWAVILDHKSETPLTSFNVGWGTHHLTAVAASRAVTEAAQSRLGFIHGAREDLVAKPVYNASNVQDSKAFKYFSGLSAMYPWQEVADRKKMEFSRDLDENLRNLVHSLQDQGLDTVGAFDLTISSMNIPVYRVIVPGLIHNRKLV